ncbi:hypothetical protein Tco_0992412 [Tanacetum coccineum]|uniref:Uncharacterized protein n=1 Tax=Tanacetum coccineum TaxID=301880 RepID=A0ABQ5F220_9ASTR
MAISVISISSEESVGTSTARVILFGTIPATIPATVPIVDPPIVHDDTPLIPTETPTIPPTAPTIPYTLQFMYTDSSDSDSSNITSVRKMLTVRQRVGLLPTHQLALRYLEDHFSSDHFISDDSSPDSSSDSASGYSSGHFIPDSPFDTPVAISARLSHKRCRSPTTSVPIATLVPGALSLVRADLQLPRKRTRGSIFMTDFEVSSEESYEPYTEPDIDSDVLADIDACIMADTAAARETDVRVDVGIEIKDEVEEEAASRDRGTIKIVIDRVSQPIVSDDDP